MIAKKANANANARPNNANAAKANANAARRELEAMRKELEALTAAKAAAEAEKLNLQSKLEKAQETGANVNSLRQAYTKAQNAAVKMEANFKAKLTEATEEAKQARANANAARTNAEAKQQRAERAEATAADHLAAKEAAETAASEAANAAEAALAEKAALNTQYALAEIRIKAVTANKNASAAERNAARANAAAARARTAEANARARAAESARLSATAAATAAIRKASANVAEARLQFEANQKKKSQYSSTGLIPGVAPHVTNTSRGKYASPPTILKPYRNRYNQAMAYGNSSMQLSALKQLQRNLQGFTPNNSTRNNKRNLSENIMNALGKLETLNQRTQRYAAYATGTNRAPAPSQNVWKNVFGR